MNILSPERLDELTLEWEEAYTRGKAKLTHKQFIAQAEQKNTLEQLEPYIQNLGARDGKPDMWIVISKRDWQELKAGG